MFARKSLTSWWVPACALVASIGCGSEPPGATDNYVISQTGGFTAGVLGGTGGSFAPGGSLTQGTGATLVTTGTGGAVGGTVSGTGGMVGTVATPSDLPCDVQKALEVNCWKCHNNPPNWGGPMPLVTQADFLAMGKVTTASVVRDLVKTRINATTNAMPPITEPAITADDLAVLNQWLDAGTPVGDGSSCTTMDDPNTMGTGGSMDPVVLDPNDPYSDSQQWINSPGWPGGVAPQETCYQFIRHGGQTPNDTTPHNVKAGEYYANFYYKVPWTQDSVMTKYRTVYDQTQVLHHWLLYESFAATSKDGNWEELSADTLTAGAHTTAGNLVAGWAVGGRSETMPAGVGMVMPPPGGMFELEWHLFNSTGMTVPDRSGIEICVVPKSGVDPKYIAGISWLGTENLTIPANSTVTQGGICTPSFKSGSPITIVSWNPHMHLLGVHMDTWVMHADGTEDHVFNEPFQFDFQISHQQNPLYEVKQGDKLHSVCTYNNTTSALVLFGQPTTKEMCYQFVMSYPAGSLDNGTVLTGASNGCGLELLNANHTVSQHTN